MPADKTRKRFTEAEWFRLPLTLRERWWQETNYGRRPPSPGWLATIKGELRKKGKSGPTQG